MKEIFFICLFLIIILNCNSMDEIRIDSEPKKLVQLYEGRYYFYIYNSKDLTTIYFNITDVNYKLDNSHIEVCYTDESPSDLMEFPDCFDKQILNNYEYSEISGKTSYFYKYSSSTNKKYLVISCNGNNKYLGYIYVQASYNDLYELLTELSTLVIVVIVIGSVAVIIIIIIIIICCKIKRKNRDAQTPKIIVDNDDPLVTESNSIISN